MALYGVLYNIEVFKGNHLHPTTMTQQQKIEYFEDSVKRLVSLEQLDRPLTAEEKEELDDLNALLFTSQVFHGVMGE